MTKEILKNYHNLKPSCDIESHREEFGRGFSTITTSYSGSYAGKAAAEELLEFVRELKMNVRVLMSYYVMVKEYINNDGVTIGAKACFVMGEETYVLYDIFTAMVDGETLTFVNMTSNGDVGMSV